MRGLWNSLSELYLIKIRGWYRMRLYLSKMRKPVIPNEIYKSKKKLNLGSSNKVIPAHINVDILDEFKPDIVCNVAKLDFATNNEYDLVRASHILEHFTLAECREALSEWRRVLRVGGYLVVCVPDFEALSWRTILKPSGFELDPETYKNGWINGLFALDLPPEFRHKIVFTYKSLCELLSSSGFKVVSKLNYLIEEPYTLGISDNSCTLFSLNVAAVKAVG